MENLFTTWRKYEISDFPRHCFKVTVYVASCADGAFVSAIRVQVSAGFQELRRNVAPRHRQSTQHIVCPRLLRRAAVKTINAGNAV